LGEFDVTLTITTADGTDSTTKVEYIVTSCAVPDVSFTSNVRAAPAPLAVHFTSTTPTQYTGCDPTSWDWDFGDTGTGSGEETDHTYIDSGIFDVCLEVQVPGTSAQTCVDDYIVTSPEIELTAPVGSESWPAGTEQQIAYTLRGNPHDWVSHVRVSVSPDSGATYEEIAVVPTDSGSAGDYQTAWPVPIARGDAFRVQVVAEDGSDVQVASDQSDSDFAVTLVYEPTAELDAATGEVTLTWKGGDADIWALDGVYDASFAGGYLLAAEEQSPYVDSPPAGARAYRFANLGTDAFSPATVGKADLAISLGYNLLAVPLLPDQELYASQAAADMNGQDGNVIELAKWDHLSGSWLTHDPSWPLVDFPINAGEGFFLKAGCDSTWSVAGEVARGDRVCTQTAHGYAMFGVPTREFAMASDAAAAMLSQGCTPTEISRWLASAGIWQTHDLSWPVVDFPIDATDGFFVKAGSDAPFILNPMDVQAEAMSATEAQVTFATDVPGVAWVVYGTDPENLDSRAYDDLGVLHADTDHQITLTDLEPDTTYFLDIVFLGVVYNKRGEHYAVQTPE